MAALKNGQIPDSMLVTVGKDAYGRPARFRPEAAASWNRMRALGMPMDVSDTYRDLARQKEYEKNPPNSVGLAAKAGTSSHGWGLAVDARGACLTWLKTNGAKHGWIRTVRAEPWHFEYQAARDQYAKEDSLSAADVEALKSHIDARLGITERAPNLPRVLFGPDGYYRVPNRQKPGEYMNVIDALATIMDYAVRGYVEANAAKKAAGGGVDVTALAAALAPLVTASVSSLSDADVERLAKAAADEADKRARERLAK